MRLEGPRQSSPEMNTITATRTELLTRRSGIAFARQGRDLLVDKRSALVRELRRLDVDVADELAAAGLLGRQARSRLYDAVAEDGLEDVESAAAGAATGVEVVRVDRRVVGVRVTTLHVPRLSRSPQERGAAPVLVTPGATAAAEAYECYLERVLRLVILEATVRRLTQEIARTTRQVNALETVVIPRLECEVTHILAVLDEREREEHSRLKRARDRRPSSSSAIPGPPVAARARHQNPAEGASRPLAGLTHQEDPS